MRTFCTIITTNYHSYAITLYRSIIEQNQQDQLVVLIISEDKDYENLDHEGISVLTIPDIFAEKYADVLVAKYKTTDLDSLRWSLKPVLINHLLRKGFTKVIYCDCDIYFFNKFEFLFDQLDSAAVTLTPHRMTRNPFINEEEFLSNFRDGLFNAGFIGASFKAVEIMNWWAKACLFAMENNKEKGLQHDQKYLDLLPVFFENIEIIKHQGCNIAFWNQNECKRSLANNETLINGQYPVIFIHFTNNYIKELRLGSDPLIYPYFSKFENDFEKTNHKLNEYISGLHEFKPPNALLSLKKRLRLRTRLKNFLFNLSEKL